MSTRVLDEGPEEGSIWPTRRSRSRSRTTRREIDVTIGGLQRELPEAVRTLVEARTGDVVCAVGPKYTIVHRDEQMESLSGVLSEEVLGKLCYEAVMGEGEKGRPFSA